MRPVPKDRPFYAIDAYGEVQHVRWIGHVGGPFGEYVEVIDSDGECFPVSDISAWDDDGVTLELVAPLLPPVMRERPSSRIVVDPKPTVYVSTPMGFDSWAARRWFTEPRTERDHLRLGREFHRLMLEGGHPSEALAQAIDLFAASLNEEPGARHFALRNPRLERATDGR